MRVRVWQDCLDVVETMESEESWGLLLSKLRESRVFEPRKSEILHSLVRHSLLLENRQSLTQDDVMMIANLLPDWSELQSIPLTTPTTGAPALLSLMKLLRNACAGVPGNQSYLLQAGVLEKVSKIVSCFSTVRQETPVAADDSRCLVVTAMLQLLGNVCVGFPEGQERVWRMFFPHLFLSILDVFTEVEMVSMVIHNCTCTEEAKNRRRELMTTEGGVAILSHIVRSQEEKNTEWRWIFLRSFLEQVSPSELHHVLIPFQPGLWTALLDTTCHFMNHDNEDDDVGDVGGAKGAWPQWEAGECVYLVEVWRGEVARLLGNQAAILVESSQAASTSSLSPAAKMNVVVVTTVLKVLCCLSVREKWLPFLQTEAPLLEAALELLKQLSTIDGSMHSTKHLSNLKKSEKTTETARENPLFGLKRDLLQLISSLLYRCPAMQNKIRELEAIPLILNQCHIDHNNPYIMQWAVLTVRNLCEDSPANQELIAKLETRGVAEATAAQFRPGCEVEVNRHGKLKIKQNT